MLGIFNNPSKLNKDPAITLLQSLHNYVNNLLKKGKNCEYEKKKDNTSKICTHLQRTRAAKNIQIF